MSRFRREDYFVCVDEFVKYENGELDEEQIVNLFQRLVNNGMAWTLQGHYGRTANSLIDAGLVHGAKYGYA